jgi:hypothetical protein
LNSSLSLFQSSLKLRRETGEVPFDSTGPTDQDMVGAGNSIFRQGIASERAKSALHPVPDDRIADLLGDREANAHGRIVIPTRTDEQNESGHGCALAAIGGKEIRALG